MCTAEGLVWTNESAIEWMFDIQLGRRNLSPIQRIAVAEKYRPLYEKQAKEQQSKYYGNQYDKKVDLRKNYHKSRMIKNVIRLQIKN